MKNLALAERKQETMPCTFENKLVAPKMGFFIYLENILQKVLR